MSLIHRYLPLVLALTGALLLAIMPLPAAVADVRPAWALLVLTVWAYRRDDVGLLLPAFICGLLLDTLFNSAFGAHALALTSCVALTLWLRPLLRSMALWQNLLPIAAVISSYTLLVHWTDLLSNHGASLSLRWWAALVTFLLWPLAALLLRDTRAEAADEAV